MASKAWIENKLTAATLGFGFEYVTCIIVGVQHVPPARMSQSKLL